MTNLQTGITYFFAVTAYNTANLESDFSNEVSYTPASVPSNSTPVAQAKTVTTPEDAAVSVILTATDADGDPLTFAVVGSPTRGTLSGTAPNLTYIPTANYSGADSFTFKVNDGKVDSATATVSITVSAVNDAPVAQARNVTTPEDTAVGVLLSGTDIDGDPLSFAVVGSPTRGTLSDIDFEDAEKQIKEDKEIAKKLFDKLCLPFIFNKRPEWDKFAGASYTISLDVLMPSQRTLQLGSIHQYKDNFSKPFVCLLQHYFGLGFGYCIGECLFGIDVLRCVLYRNQ